MLEDYKKKRDFKKTTEPPPLPKAGTGPLVFVVQKHAASHLHYDFRLELDGVLKSWALPKGPSPDPNIKRLAVMVEDHPLEYGSFEGSIPKGEYGAGEVIVWDSGAYYPDEMKEPDSHDREQSQNFLREGLEKGKIAVTLQGKKLKGSWALVRLKNSPKNWLLIKHKDEFASSDSDILTEDSSVNSGRTIEDLKQDSSESARSDSVALEQVKGARASPFPPSISPMLATLVNKPFNDPDWIFEPKLDGYRIIALIREGRARLISRNGLEVTGQYPFLGEELVRQPAAEFVLDGEMVAQDASGHSCFQCLQDYQKKTAKIKNAAAIIYYVFDILYLNGYDLREVPLIERKKALTEILHASKHFRLVEYFENEGESLYKAAAGSGLEGILAKQKDSPYETGRRSKYWLKIKSTLSDEFVIGGYTRGEGNREKTFGSLLLGTPDDEGKLVFAGHVGTGFDDEMLAEIKVRLDRLRSKDSHFKDLPPLNAPAVWVKPELVAEIKFAERTAEGYLRQPVFLRFREDKSPSEVRFTNIGPPEKSQSVDSASNLDRLINQIQSGGDSIKLQVEGHSLNITSPDKLLWPPAEGKPGLTKRDLLIYLARVSPFILPHLKDRPVTLTRYPNGINGERFYQRHLEASAPDFIKRVPLSEHNESPKDFFVCNNLATLLWLGQLDNIDIHSWFSRIVSDSSMLEQDRTPDMTGDYFTNFPDFIIFDIDPYIYSGKEGKGDEPELNLSAFKETCKTALWLEEVLDSLSLNAFVKTSGKTGLHIHVPISRQFDFSAVHAAAKTICEFMLKQHPDEITLEWKVIKRTGKIFLDYNQNVRGKTLASVYSPRSAPGAPVSTPLKWDELGKIYPTDFTIKTLPDRLAGVGDLWSDILAKRSDLNSILGLKSD
jgi:bifunctional non-homologous end joining protein LigD